MEEFDTVMQTRDEVEDYITIKNSRNPSRGLRRMFLLCEKDAFQNMDFSCLNCQLEQKKLTQKKLTCVVFNSKSFSNSILVPRALCFFWSPVVTVRLHSEPSGSGDENVQMISARKQNILTSQPCLHTLMQTRQTRLDPSEIRGSVLPLLFYKG